MFLNLTVKTQKNINIFSLNSIVHLDNRDAFYSELEAFKSRIVKRAKEKIAEAMAEAEEEERQARMGPGGLNF